MEISPDGIVIIALGKFTVNATVFFTWLNILLLTAGAAFVTARLRETTKMSRWQNLLEVIVEGIERQVEDIGLRPAREFVPFLGTIFLFILTANILSVIPGYQAPTGSLSTTTALGICVFIAIPWWGIRRRGFRGYFGLYLRPSPFMLPFNVIGELSRTLALAVRLFGNVMSGGMIAAILLSVVPLIFPVVMQLLGLITGVIQAYIFAVLAAVYIAAAVKVEAGHEGQLQSTGGRDHG